MGYLLEFEQWIQLNESFFNKSDGGQFAHLTDTSLLIMNKLIKGYGYSPKLAAALTGNMFRESKFDPTDQGAFFGLIQWSKIRFNDFSKIGITGAARFTIDAQLKLIDYEFNNTEKSAKKAAEAAPNVEEAAYQIAAKYERCEVSDRRHPERIQGAREIFNLYLKSTSPVAKVNH